MDNIRALIAKFVKGELTNDQFLDRLERAKERNWTLIRWWWKSPEAMESVWDDLGGFDELQYEKRVSDAFYESYSGTMLQALRPILNRRVRETPEVGVAVKQLKGLLLSDVYDRAMNAEVVEDVYRALGDDLSHWLIVHLVYYLRDAAGAKPQRVSHTR